MKYRFEVTYQNKACKDLSNFMKKCDVDIGGISLSEVFTFTCVKDKPITLLKKDLVEAFFHSGLEVVHIEGGKIE